MKHEISRRKTRVAYKSSYQKTRDIWTVERMVEQQLPLKKIFFFILLKRILQINDSFDWVSQPYNAEHIKIYLKNPQQ